MRATSTEVWTKDSNLNRFCNGSFDSAVIDGNCEGSYLRRELAILANLLREDGFVIMDDVTHHWIEIQEVFKNLDASLFESAGTDGRVGVAYRTPAERSLSS